MAFECAYLESNFYTACDHDSNGERRAEWGPDWWREFTHCEELTCLYVRKRVRRGCGTMYIHRFGTLHLDFYSR